MAVTGGDVLECRYNNDNVGEGVFYIKSGEDMTFDEGGFRNEDEASAMSGSGEAIYKMNQNRWMVEGPIVWNMITTNELERLTQLAEDLLETQWTFRHINGTIWAGTGKVVGDIQGTTQDANIPIKLSGGGKLQKVQ